jgi:hypothetical protein
MRIRVGKYRIPVPKSRSGRVGTGVLILFLGVLPGSPGLVVIPLGLTILTLDYPRGRRWRRIMLVRAGRRLQSFRGRKRLPRPMKGGADAGTGDPRF